ncbi:MAG: hypothetical protein ACI37R_01010 [Candidatus Avigastranaerophilus sp.]
MGILFKFLLFISIFVLNCSAINSNIVFAEIQTMSGDEAYKFYVLDRIDGPDIPESVKKFANDNNCFEITKSYYWSYVIFKNKGSVYFCGKNGKAQYIYEKDNNMRFSRWYEKHKFRKVIYGD